jgi:hypothetical protein
VAAIRLVHRDAAEAAKRAERLRALGHAVDGGPVDAAGLRELAREPPDAFVVDLTRLPSHGRDVAVALRRSRAGRRVPIVFAGGAPEKVARVRETLPDAVYADWDSIGDALAGALAAPPLDPVVPDSALAGYSGTPLPSKLGIKAGSVVALVGAPDGFETALEPLPEGASARRGLRGRYDLVLAFLPTRAELRRWFPALTRAGVPVWLAWPKRASGVASDLDQQVVREHALARGWVDHKVAAIDETWTGLRFVRRR